VGTLSARSLSGLGEVQAGDDLAALIVGALDAEPRHRTGVPVEAPATGRAAQTPPPSSRLHDGEIVAIAHKAVSKAEGSVVALAEIEPSPRAKEIAGEQGKDPRAVQVVLDQSSEVLRAANGVLICRTHHGFVCANAGVDASNAPCAERPRGESEVLILLPRDPDASARALRARLRELAGARVAVLITDSFGRAWRHGQCDIAIGCAGLAPLDDWRGRADSAGRELRATWLAVADAIAATADLARAKDSREPVVILDGLERFVTAQDGPGAHALLRPVNEDLFR
jgi:coenzyme F420-0:L-glutamate ligase/coenzyme F420-1:gamma-L-glutamate ligase